MTVQYRQAPTYEVPIADTASGNTHKSWYRWFRDTEKGTPPSQELAIKITASPYTYIAPSKGFVVINGGSVSQVAFTRVGTYTTGQTAGMFPVSANDKLTITYSGAPTITFVPT